MTKKWIQKASITKGGLHKSLGIPEDEHIPLNELQAKPADSTKVKRQKALARTFRRMG